MATCNCESCRKPNSLFVSNMPYIGNPSREHFKQTESPKKAPIEVVELVQKQTNIQKVTSNRKKQADKNAISLF